MKHLSRFDIEAIADKYVQAYMALPDVRNTQIYRIDPELLLEKVLGLNVEYQHLSYDGSILGMTSFTEMGVQVFEDDDMDLQHRQKRRCSLLMSQVPERLYPRPELCC